MSKGKIAKKKWDLAHPEKQDGIAYLQEAIDKIVKEEVTRLVPQTTAPFCGAGVSTAPQAQKRSLKC